MSEIILLSAPCPCPPPFPHCPPNTHRLPWGTPLVNHSHMNPHRSVCFQEATPHPTPKTSLCSRPCWRTCILKQRAEYLVQGSQQAKFGKKTCFVWLTDFKKCEGPCQHLRTGKCYTKIQISPCLEKSKDPATLSLHSCTATVVWGGLGASPQQPPSH